ncbi:MAG: Tm-1-like ATP-binding domain-containing protein [Acetobacteraceae bacterium]|nr:Tm-1-like ATP-binding domain-containing protein [Acetobacteraceae bacterium]
MARAYVCGTFDTKGPELQFIAGRLEAAGIATCCVDLSTRPHDVCVEIKAGDVAGAHEGGADAVLGRQDRGAAVTAMSVAFERFIRTRDDVAGIIGAGGSGNTALVAPAMRALPVGVPKLIVSTIASGQVAPYVRESDICMMPSVADVQGLNSISRRVLANAAHALAGMVRFRDTQAERSAKPAIGLTMFGVTTSCVQRVASMLEATHDCIVFHAVGTGGRSMEALVDAGLISGVIDVTTTEVCDMMMGGVFAAEPTRFDAIIRTRVPYVVSCGALDMVNFGAMETVPMQHRERRLHVHNPQVTLMRTTAEENARMGAWIAGKLNRMEGEVRLLIPEGGVSAIDVPGQPFHDPDADRALFDSLMAHVVQTESRRVVRLPYAINDPPFVEALVAAFRSIAV